MRIRAVIAAIAMSLGLPFVAPTPARAAWLEYKSSPTDTSNAGLVTSAYDITRVDFAIETSSPDEYWFFLNFLNPIKGDMFSVDSWAGIMIDTNLDGSPDFSVQTNLPSLPYSGNYYMDAVAKDRRSTPSTLIPGCKARTWTNLDKAATWIGFSVKKDCFPFGRIFAVYGYSDHIPNNDTDFDRAPESIWLVAPGAAVTSNVFPEASSLSRNQLAAQSQTTLTRIPNPALPPEDLVALSSRITPSVVTVLCGGGSGTGWAIQAVLSPPMTGAGNTSYVITNHHVIEDCLASKQVTLVLSNQSRVSGQVWAWSKTDDTASIVTATYIPPLDWVGASPQQGWWVGVLGSPLGYPGILTTGIVSSVNPQTSRLTTTAPLNPGNSGGPVFDRNGRVVGLATAKYVNTEGFGIVHGVPLLCGQIIDCQFTSNIWSQDRTLLQPVPKVVKKTITCVKGRLIKKVTSLNPRCPTGYKRALVQIKSAVRPGE